jgi:hypothetical protein
MSNKEVTPEEREQRDLLELKGRNVSLVFLRKNPAFVSSQENAAKMMELLAREPEGQRDWALENITRVFESHKDQFALSEVKGPEPEVQTQPAIVEKDRPVWADSVIDRFAIDSIPREQYRKWMKDPAFQQAVNRTLRSGQ